MDYWQKDVKEVIEVILGDFPKEEFHEFALLIGKVFRTFGKRFDRDRVLGENKDKLKEEVG